MFISVVDNWNCSHGFWSLLTALPPSCLFFPPSNFIFLCDQEIWHIKASQTPLRLSSQLSSSKVTGKRRNWYLLFVLNRNYDIKKPFLRLRDGLDVWTIAPFKVSAINLDSVSSKVSFLINRWCIAIKTSNTIYCIFKGLNQVICMLKAIYWLC